MRNISKDWRHEKKRKKEQHFGVPKVLHCVLALPVKKKKRTYYILVLEVHFRDRSRSKC